MQIRLYLDEDAMSRSLARELRARGIEVTTTISEGMLGRDDAAQLEFAKTQGRVIYTYNVADYYRLHTEYIMQGKTHAGIILGNQRRYTIGEQIRRVLKLMAALSAEDMQNRAEYLSAWS
jgi:predicted nuclease of predicted toxin-antitoxin system